MGAGPATASTHAPKTNTSGPPTVTLHLVGATGLTGPVTPSIIDCAEPSLTGSTILVIGASPKASLSVRVVVRATTVEVDLDTGSGAQYEERDFTGTDVAGFKATRGVTLNATLTPAAVAPGTSVPDLPVLSSIAGTVHCAGQTPGKSTLTVSGQTETGKASGHIAPVRVTCLTGQQVLIIGIVKIGKSKVLIDMSVYNGLFSFFLETSSNGSHQYKAPAGSATATPTGAKVKGTAVEVVTTGTPHTLKITGRVTCGKEAVNEVG